VIRKATNKDEKAIKELIGKFPGFLMKHIPKMNSYILKK
jgi:N-acetylglutamate synthase-like GNAT family acetyltransferase